LLDTYGSLLTERQRTLLGRYYENDLSFGEVAAEVGVSRQAVFSTVRQGERSLERFETHLALVAGGWTQWQTTGLTPSIVAERLGEARGRLNGAPESAEPARMLDELIAVLAPPNADLPKD